LRAWRNAWPWFDIADDLEMEIFSKIRPGAVVGNDFAAGVRLHLGHPFFIGLLNALLEIIIALCEVGGVIGVHFREFILNSFRYAQTVFRIEPVVWIAEGMDVAFSARHHAGGNFQNPGITRRVEIAWRAHLDFGVRGLRDQRWKPADFKFQADHNEQIGVAKFQKKTGLGFDEVWILVAA